MKFFAKDELGLLWPFYLDAIISPMLFFAPAFYVIYFKSLELSLFQVGLLLAAVSLTALVFEIPTGAFADIYGRKNSVLLGLSLEGIGFFALFFITNYYLLLLVFAFIGFASTFSSGAKEAWVTDLIKHSKKDFLQKYFVKIQSFDSFGLVVSGIIGAWLVKGFGMSIIWPIAALSFLVSVLLLVFGKEYFIKAKSSAKKALKKITIQTKKSVSYSRKHHVLSYFLIASAIFAVVSSFNCDISWFPLLQSLGLPDYAFGYLWSAMTAIGIFAPIIGSKLYKKNKERKFIITMLILDAIFAVSILFVKELIFAFVILASITFFWFARSPAERIYFHRFIPGRLRATIGSVEAMLMALVGIIAIPLAGLSVDLLGPKYTIFLGGIFIIPMVIVYYKIKEKKPKHI